MAGVKKYNREDLLDRAIELFRIQGFNGTSTAELVSELGVNRKSMYSEFGSKHDLFHSALERYNEIHLSRVIAPIEKHDADTNSIRVAFGGYASASSGWARGKGCLMCNTSVERGALSDESGMYVDAYYERLNKAFRQALFNGQRSGQIDATSDLDELAYFFTTALVGVAATIRGEATPEQVQAGCKIVTSVLDTHRPKQLYST
jgi:TetR/AcrR family transcriptional repressor of nem operon